MSETVTQIPPLREGERVMSRSEAMKSRKPGLRELQCQVWAPSESNWYDRIVGYCRVRPTATMTVRDAMAASGNNWLLYIIDPTGILGGKDEPVRRCSWESVLGYDIIAKLKLAPGNATFRAMVMAAVGEHPPADADTWEKVKDWVEFNFPKVLDAKPSTSKPEIRVRVSISQEETGRCNYARTAYGAVTIEVTDEEIMSAFRDNPDDLDELLQCVAEKVREKADHNVVYDNYDNLRTTSYSVSDSGEPEYDYDFRAVKDGVMRVLRARLSEEERSEIGM